jgi:hypothetical protein
MRRLVLVGLTACGFAPRASAIDGTVDTATGSADARVADASDAMAGNARGDRG